MSLDLNAKQTSVKSLFTDKLYRIPAYQRPYSWGEEQCEKLWIDIIDHFSSGDIEDSYFLGNIVLAEDKNEEGQKIWNVIDGQQRLITFSLLLRELFDNDCSNSALKACIYNLDDRDINLIKGFRVHSTVLSGAEKEKFEKCLRLDRSIDVITEQDNYGKNYLFFRKQIELFKKNDLNRTELPKFIDNLLTKISILPIECSSTSKALTIFETINNRGLDLSDGDIFKSKLYKMAENNEKQFIERWDNLVSDVNKFFQDYKFKDSSPITSLFRMYMYLLRAKNEDRTKPVKLRDFFDGKVLNLSKKRVEKPLEIYQLDKFQWEDVLNSLEKLVVAWRYIYENSYKDTGISQWYSLLKGYGSDQILYPVLIYFYYNIDFSTEYPCLKKNKKEECVKFLKNISRYVFAKGFWGSSIEGSTIEDEMVKIAILVTKNEIYTPKMVIKRELLEYLNFPLSSRYRRGFSAILTLTNLDQDLSLLENFDSAQVEHILPKKWDDNYYDTWSKDKVIEIMDTLGNLTLIEKSNNIKGSNLFFNAKKEKSYKESKYYETKRLIDMPQWTHDQYQQNHERAKMILKDFFEKPI